MIFAAPFSAATASPRLAASLPACSASFLYSAKILVVTVIRRRFARRRLRLPRWLIYDKETHQNIVPLRTRLGLVQMKLVAPR